MNSANERARPVPVLAFGITAQVLRLRAGYTSDVPRSIDALKRLHGDEQQEGSARLAPVKDSPMKLNPSLLAPPSTRVPRLQTAGFCSRLGGELGRAALLRGGAIKGRLMKICGPADACQLTTTAMQA